MSYSYYFTHNFIFFPLCFISHFPILDYFHSFEHTFRAFTACEGFVRFSLFRATSELNYSIRFEQQSKGSRRTNRLRSGRVDRVARIPASFSRSSVINSKLIGNVNTTRRTYIIGIRNVSRRWFIVVIPSLYIRVHFSQL